MKRILIAALSTLLVGGGFALASELDSSPSVDRTALTTTTEDRTTTVDDRGGDRDRNGERRREAGEDLRGPCDEAEHANDPRCTGAAGDRRADDDRRDDGVRHGNSGPGSANSGRGSADDRDDDGDDRAGRRGADDPVTHDVGDDRGGREAEPGDDRGGREADPGDDRGGDDRGGHGSDD